MQTKNASYTVGLDIGIASVGWCVLGEDHIIDLGVRAFDKAETDKEGESLNLIRRQTRLARRRLRRRAWRLTRLARVLKREGLINSADLFKLQTPCSQAVWSLRVEALDRLLNPEEWARVIYHLCKHRGFHWTNKAEALAGEDGKSESGRVKQGLAHTQQLMRDKGYRTAAEMVLAEFPDAQRNKQGDYSKALSRALLDEEFAELFQAQRKLGNPHASAEFEEALRGTGDQKSGLFWVQKPPLSGADLLKMLGRCTFEKTEYRAPKASFTAERHVWLTRLNNLRIVCDGSTRSLTEAERQFALPLPYAYDTDITYKRLRDALVKAGYLSESFRFIGLSYPSEQQKADKAKDPEAAVLIKIPAWQEMRKVFKKVGLETEWQSLAGQATGGDPTLLDQIAWVLSVYKEDAEVSEQLSKLSLPNANKLIDALLCIRFDKFHSLSLKALRKIVPYMEAGLRYDEACVKAQYHHSQPKQLDQNKQKYLPPLYEQARDKTGKMVFAENLDVPRNPVVLRAVNQARKVLNAIIRQYGSPAAVHIEMARNLSQPLDERNKIKKEQEAYRDRNDAIRNEFFEGFGRKPTGTELEKFRLYREQQSKCAYSLMSIDLTRLREEGYVEIDHALPLSRSFDDSKNNKVLVLTRENRNKGNQTPFEYLDGKNNSERWQRFEASVLANKAYRQAKRSRLLRKDFGKEQAEEFRQRNLNDTRYICRFVKNYIEQHLQLSSESKRCVVLSGQLTSFLRAHWGLIKVRSDNDRHHALDAAVVAACSHSMVKRLSDYSRSKELEKVREGFVDAETGEIINPTMFKLLHTHFPSPWGHFRDELQARLNIDSCAQLREEMEKFNTYEPEDLECLRPLFVSRAPQRRNGGAAHKDTIYGQPERLKPQGGATQKVALSSLTLKDIDKLVDPHRNEKLYTAIRARLEAHGGKADKAFSASNPLFKPDRAGNPTGPLVRTVTLEIDKLSGIPVRGGIAKNDTMLRTDVFTKEGKFHLVPVYVHHAATGLPDRAIVAAKDESEWTLIDESFSFCFSLHPNDLVRVRLKGKEPIFGYYSGCDRATGGISLWAHDRSHMVGKDGLIRSVGVKLALSIEKFDVDVLGHIYPARPEVRRGLA